MNSSYQYSFNDSRGGTDCNVCRNRNIEMQAQLFVMTTQSAHNGIDWIL
jgi:hypothetical protein